MAGIRQIPISDKEILRLIQRENEDLGLVIDILDFSRNYNFNSGIIKNIK